MSNYNLQINWSGKDALSDSDPEKVISGDDMNTEFSAVKTAVNSKADLAGSAGQSFSASTAASGTNTTQVATTAFVQDALEAVYPVGSIFITTNNYADSAAVVAAIGGTTWVRFGAGRTLVGYDSADTDFDTSEETGGAKTHTLTADEIPQHTHTYTGNGADDGTAADFPGDYMVFDNSSAGTVTDVTTATGGNAGGGAHSNMQPYIVTYMWKRTA